MMWSQDVIQAILHQVICGTNTGYHMLFEASNSCATLALSWTAATPRQWDIKISQVKIFCQSFILASSERGLFVWQFVCLLQSWRHFAQMDFFAPLPDGLYINLWRLPLLGRTPHRTNFDFIFSLAGTDFSYWLRHTDFWTYLHKMQVQRLVYIQAKGSLY